ncbi:MAG: hypothetical protein M3R47_08405, partial [Chloroflexota bacterium]|nr:hypothetical protein [Chloroflexota bacterium]
SHVSYSFAGKARSYLLTLLGTRRARHNISEPAPSVPGIESQMPNIAPNLHSLVTWYFSAKVNAGLLCQKIERFY